MPNAIAYQNWCNIDFFGGLFWLSKPGPAYCNGKRNNRNDA